MADKKITELNELTSIASTDLFAVVDTSETQTKKVSFSSLSTSLTSSLVESAYISLYSTSSQQLAASGSAQPVTFSSLWATKGITLQSGSRLVMEKKGVYQFNFVAQLANPDNAVHDSWFWIKYNGENFPNSTTQMTLQPRKSADEPSAQLMSMNIVGQNIVENGYIELYWTGDSTTTLLKEAPAFGPVPETPSIVADIIRVG